MRAQDVASEFLLTYRSAIIEGAEAVLLEAPGRYRSVDATLRRSRLEALYDELQRGVARRELGGVISYAQRLARERFAGGYDLAEVQTAINALEEQTWKQIFSTLPPAGYAPTLGPVSAILGAAKDALAREYVSLATHGHVPTLDLNLLSSGTAETAG